MSSLTGSSISGTYDQLLALPSGGGNGASLVALTDGNGGTTFALQISSAGIKSTGTLEVTGAVTVGVEGTGHDVKFYGDTSTNGYMLWDQSRDDLILGPSSNLGIGTTAPSYRLEVEGSDNELVKIKSTDAGCLLRLEDDSTSGFAGIGVTGDNLYLKNNGDNHRIYIKSGGKVGIGDTAPDAFLTVNQGADDSYCISLKSSDVSHGLTSYAETDTYGELMKADSENGGLRIRGIAEDDTDSDNSLFFEAYGGRASTAKTTSAIGLFDFYAVQHDGSNAVANLAADGNIMSVRARRGGAIATVFIIDEDGDLHADAGGGDLSTGAGYTTVKTYDEYNDAHLVRAIDMNQSSVSAGLINSEFDKFVEYNSEKLADLKLIGREEDGTPNHMVNVTGMQRLHNGAIWQQYEEHQKLLNAFVKLAEKTVGLEEAKALIDDNEIKKLGDA
tara:strand:- start:472 stop:1806 length:1335 start_codon:yes stop_codon:yes gene_type:complete